MQKVKFPKKILTIYNNYSIIVVTGGELFERQGFKH